MRTSFAASLFALVACAPAADALEPPADATKLCSGHVSGAPAPDGKPGAHITWDAWSSPSSRESHVKHYSESLEGKPETTRGCTIWRFPHDKPVQVLEVCEANAEGPWKWSCPPVPKEARSIVMISSMARSD